MRNESHKFPEEAVERFNCFRIGVGAYSFTLLKPNHRLSLGVLSQSLSALFHLQNPHEEERVGAGPLRTARASVTSRMAASGSVATSWTLMSN